MAELLEERIRIREVERNEDGVFLRINFVVQFAEYEISPSANFSAEFQLFSVDYRPNISVRRSRRWREHELPLIHQHRMRIDSEEFHFRAITFDYNSGRDVPALGNRFRRFSSETTFFPYSIVNEDGEGDDDELTVRVIIDPRIPKGDNKFSSRIMRLRNIG